jgi:hypothetical protein
MSRPEASSEARLIFLPDEIFSKELSKPLENALNAFPEDWLKVFVLIVRDMVPPITLCFITTH